MHRAGSFGPCPRPVDIHFGDSLVSGQQARGLASFQGLPLVIFSCFSFLFLFQLSTPRVSHLSTLCSLGCPVYNMLSLKRRFVLRSIANSPPGSCCRDKGSKVSRWESMHTSPPEPKGCMDLMGSLGQSKRLKPHACLGHQRRGQAAPEAWVYFCPQGCTGDSV